MKHTLIIKKIGLKNIETKQFSTPHKIRDICVVDNNIFVLHNCFLGVINSNSNLYLLNNLSNPSSLSYYNNNLYIVEDAGRNIRKISIDDIINYPDNIKSIFYETTLNKINTLLKNIPHDCETAICVLDDNHIYWLSQVACRVFNYTLSEFNIFAGNGRAGNIMSNDKNYCSFNFPSGIFYENNYLYIADTNNKCIKIINNNTIKTIDINFKPKKIKILDDKIIVNNDNSIIYFSSNYNGNINLYNNKNISCFDVKDKKLYIIESE